MTIGYACVSPSDQHLDTTLNALRQAGREDLFQDKITGVSTNRLALETLLAQLRAGEMVMPVGHCRGPLLWLST